MPSVSTSQTVPESHHLPKIAIIGKPNVGKSTFFNVLCQRNFAITSRQAGTTRDRREHLGSLLDLSFMIIDTAGWEDENNGDTVIEIAMRQQTEIAILEADLMLFIVDGRNGITKDDLDFIQKIRKSNKPYILLANKTEGKLSADNLSYIYSLGLGEPILISATHRLGLDQLYLAIREKLPELGTNREQQQYGPPGIAIIGRPNAGKSTLFNTIIGHERSIVTNIAGTTRDAMTHVAHGYSFIDTAGLRKRSRIHEEIENMSAGQSITAIRRSDVTLLVLDGTEEPAKQDLSLAHVAINEGKGLIIIVNKCDQIKDTAKVREQLNHSWAILQSIHKLPILFISALDDSCVSKILRTIAAVQKNRETKFSTTALNKWLQTAVQQHFPPSLRHGKSTRLKYITQTSVKPPTFEIFSNVKSGDFPEHYIRYLQKSLANRFDICGTPVRIKIKKTTNPYVDQ